MFFSLYKSTDNGVFDDFPKISDHFPRIVPKIRRTFPGTFPKISENFRRCPKIAEDVRGRPEDVSMMHQRI